MQNKLKAALALSPLAILAAAPAFATDTVPDLTTMSTQVTTLQGNVTTLVAGAATVIGGIIALRFLKVGSGVGFSLLNGLGRKS